MSHYNNVHVINRSLDVLNYVYQVGQVGYGVFEGKHQTLLLKSTVICAISLPLQTGCLFINAHFLGSNQGHKNLLLYLFTRTEGVDSNSILFPDRMITLPFFQMGEVYTTTPVLKDQVWSSVRKIFGHIQSRS